MARYEHLPIYKKAMEITVYLENIVRNFSRYNKYTIGSDLRNTSRNIIKTIIRANSNENKLRDLEILRDEIEELIIIIRIGKEVKAFKNFNSFKYLIGEVIILSKQNQGWLNSQKKKTSLA